MPRWLHPPADGAKRDRLDREAAAEIHRRVATVNGTIRTEDKRGEPGAGDLRIVVRKDELLTLAPESLGDSAAYAAVNTLQAQDFMIPLSDGSKATVPSTGTHWLQVQRHIEAHAKQLQDANKDPRPGKRKRGRPSKQE